MSNPVGNVWDVFIAINFSFPAVIFTFFLLLSLLYWCVAVVGLLDLDILDADVDSPDAGSVSGLLMRFGLNGVPVTIVVTLISLFGWFISAIASYYIMSWVPMPLLKFIVGAGILLLSLYLATLLTAQVIKPIRPAFLASSRQKNTALVGRVAVVRTGVVTETFGEATLNDGGADLIIRVRTYPDQNLKRGDRVVLLEHDPIENSYKVISEEEHQAGYIH